MPNYDAREWILSLVTTPERAASILGDLLESDCGALRSWAAIGSHVLHAMTPGLAGLALGGFLAQFVFFLIPAVALGAGFRRSMLSFDQLRVCIALACIGTEILTGYWIGRRSESRALLVGLSIALMDCAVGACNVNNASINMAVWSVPLMAGAILYRRRRHGLAA